MKAQLTHFLKARVKEGDKLLLALSGGPDSMALFINLLEVCPLLGLSFEVAHVDHGWRKESAQEAKELQKFCCSKNIYFHVKTLNMAPGNNLENRARLARYHFFRTLTHEKNFVALLTAHHADDRAETVLKRVLEGASLHQLRGIKEEGCVQGVLVWRPLLQVRKKEILNFLKENKIDYFDDYTNNDPQFLRARIRKEIFPTIAKSFGKEVVPALCQVAKRAEELEHFLHKVMIPYKNLVKYCGLGVWINLSKQFPTTIFEQRWVIKYLLEQEGFFLSSSSLAHVLFHLRKKSANVSLKHKRGEIHIDRGSVFLLKESKKGFKMEIPLVSGVQKVGEWKIEVSKGEGDKTCWRSLWGEGLSCTLPLDKSYALGFGAKLDTKRLSKAKVPNFLKDRVPSVIDLESKEVVHEFLSGKGSPHLKRHGTRIKIFTEDPLFSVEAQLENAVS